ncbi:MAG: prepilin-type N-terminal cleavage/methylation domain-containing protein [Elusimicrobiaceae bacterium]|nr:prepilin-type N-terminal cleavage/methylation domain-containing protein [Elusimicrobiaceae bacterium]
MQNKKAFTLIELLVVLLIIGVLVAMALPQYQNAVDQSRYSRLMPLGKTLAAAQESYYLTSGTYTKDLSTLNIELPGSPSGISATLENGTTITLSEEPDYSYIKLTENNLKNNYIVYLANSENFSGEIHCEALKNSARAQQLCEVLNGEPIAGSLTDGYDTYVLEGSGNGTPASLAREMANAPTGWQACENYPCNKTCAREVHVNAGYTCEGTYNENKTYTEKICQSNSTSTVCVNATYDANGRIRQETVCKVNGNNCTASRTYLYNNKGEVIAKTGACTGTNTDGSCASYGNGTSYLYDEDKNQIVISCKQFYSNGDCAEYESGVFHVYDATGKDIIERNCEVFNGSTCAQWASSQNNDYTYDDDGNIISTRSCASIDSDGICTAYAANEASVDYTYEDGVLVSEKQCTSFEGRNCTAYGPTTNYTKPNFNYQYDTDGNVSAQRKCATVGAGGACTSYSTSDNTDYTYDAAKNITSVRTCGSNVNSQGVCTAYTVSDESKDYTYDAYGNVTGEYKCGSFDGTTCTSYSSGSKYMYDEKGNLLSTSVCNSWSGKTCSSWGSATVS